GRDGRRSQVCWSSRGRRRLCGRFRDVGVGRIAGRAECAHTIPIESLSRESGVTISGNVGTGGENFREVATARPAPTLDFNPLLVGALVGYAALVRCG